MRNFKHLSKLGIVLALVVLFVLTSFSPVLSSIATPQVEYTDLAYDVLQSEQYKDWTFKQWDDQIKYRGVDFKYPEKLVEAAQCYERKIPLIEEQLIKIAIAKTHPELFPEILVDSEQSLVDKLARLKEKYACVLKEQEFRKDKKVSRKLHGTTYYIDLDGGSDAADGLGTGTAWLTIEKYTTTTVRSAGDIAKVRANTSETVGAANIAFDEDGTINNYIEIRGCSIADDPWSDASDVKPIIDFNSGAYYLYFAETYFWRLYRLDVSGADSINIVAEGADIILDSCYVHDSSVGALLNYVSGLIKDCAFDNNSYENISFNPAFMTIENTTFDGTGDEGIGADSYSWLYFMDCKFGDTTPHNVTDIYVYSNAVCCLRNCKLATTPEVIIEEFYLGGRIFSEDHDQVKGAQRTYYYVGQIDRDSSVQLDSLDSAKMSPNSNCGAVQALTLSGNPLQGDYQIWCPASETTITIKARETADWAVDPSATEFYFEASYLDEAAASAHRATQVSAQGLSGTNEISFTMTITPAQVGWVYIICYLKDYESGKYINVSVKPTVE